MGVPTQDQFGNNTGSGGTTFSSTVTASSGTTIIFGINVVTNTTTGGPPSLSITGAGGLTWTQVGTASGASGVNSRYYNITVWEAQAPSGLSAATIQVTSTVVIDCCVSCWESLFTVGTPFIDPNSGLPVQTFQNSSVTPQVGVYSTTDSPDLLFAFVGSNTTLSYAVSASPSGGSVVTSNSKAGTGVNTARLGLLTVPVFTAQSSLTWGNGGASNESNWAFVGSALVGAATAPGAQLFLNPGLF